MGKEHNQEDSQKSAWTIFECLPLGRLNYGDHHKNTWLDRNLD